MTNLTSYLHDKFMTSGEIAPVSHLAELIQDYERHWDQEFDAYEIKRAVRDASDSFVDSMVANEYNTHYDCLDDQDAAVARWEAMRPSVRRRAAIEKILA